MIQRIGRYIVYNVAAEDQLQYDADDEGEVGELPENRRILLERRNVPIPLVEQGVSVLNPPMAFVLLTRF